MCYLYYAVCEEYIRYCHAYFNLLLVLHKLTLNVRGPSYLGLTRSISWLLMPWLLTSPGHQQPWYLLCRICKSWSYSRKDLSTCVISMWSNEIKCKYMFMFPLNNLTRKGLIKEVWCHNNPEPGRHVTLFVTVFAESVGATDYLL